MCVDNIILHIDQDPIVADKYQNKFYERDGEVVMFLKFFMTLVKIWKQLKDLHENLKENISFIRRCY